MIKEFPSIVEAYLEETVLYKKTDVFLKVVEDLEPSLYWRVIEQIAGTTPELIAGILELAQPKIAQDILLDMKQDEIEALYEMISDQDLYKILKKTDYLLMLSGKNFPITRLKEKEKKEILKCFYVLCRDEKVEFLEQLDENMCWELYGQLSKNDQQDILELVEDEMAFFILNEKKCKGEKFSFWEQMLYDKLKADKKEIGIQ